MTGLIPFWTHALAAALFAALALWELRRGVAESQQRMLLGAFALTSCWAWLAATLPYSTMAGYAETARNLAWIGVLYQMSRLGKGEGPRGVSPVYASVAAVFGLQLVIDTIPLILDLPSVGVGHPLVVSAIVLRLAAAAGSLVLVHNLYGQAAPADRGSIRLAMIGLAVMWAYDLNLYTTAYFEPQSAQTLFDWRGLAMTLVAPLFALVVSKGNAWRIQLSRAATFQSISFVAIGTYFVLMAIMTSVLRESGFGWVSGTLVTVLAAATIGAILFLPSRRMRGWAKVKIAKHFFEHRYDYRAEWLRFTQTIGKSGPDAAPLGERVIKAFADILDAPGGLLLVADENGVIEPSASWNWNGSDNPGATVPGPEALAFWLSMGAEGRIIDFDAHSGGWAEPRDKAIAIPDPLLSEEQAWTGIPLIHEDRLVGLVLLASPDYRRPLDWEDFDLLRTAGRQAASSIAEAHGQLALINAQRFDDFNRRFAFILHDVKNLVSQLSLLARNAERHADNPEFRSDMVATLKGSVGKMNDLLERLAPTSDQRPAKPEPVALLPLIASAIAGARASHDINLVGDGNQWVMADPLLLEQAVRHLVQNAVDASTPIQPVTVRMSGSADEMYITIVDQGQGMDADFIRNRLFQPFASTKQGGFGVGAFEARSLIAAMGGRLTVESKPGRGSSFTITLPTAAPESHEKRNVA